MVKQRMGRIRPLASALRVWRPVELGRAGLPRAAADRPSGPWLGGPVRWAAGAAPSACPAVITAQRVHAVARQVRAHWRLAWGKVFAWSAGAERGR
jgi:hypothetical protein